MKEISLRKRLCETILLGAEIKADGSIHNKIVGDDNAIYKATQNISRSIDPSALESIWTDLSDEEKSCIKYVPKVSWAKIPDGSVLWDIIVEKPATPVLSRIEEKDGV